MRSSLRLPLRFDRLAVFLAHYMPALLANGGLSQGEKEAVARAVEAAQAVTLGYFDRPDQNAVAGLHWGYTRLTGLLTLAVAAALPPDAQLRYREILTDLTASRPTEAFA